MDLSDLSKFDIIEPSDEPYSLKEKILITTLGLTAILVNLGVFIFL